MMERRRAMEVGIDRLLELVADVRDRANANAVLGEPVTSEGRTVIPVAKVAYAFAAGMGDWGTVAPEGQATAQPAQETGDDGGHGSGGGGMTAQPIAVVEVTPQTIRVKPIVDRQKLTLARGLVVGWIAFWFIQALVKIFGRRT
jgi:uncharacterized spore protein YtfJ